MKLQRLSVLVAIFCIGAVWAQSVLALQPDEILLVTNKNSPDSQKLASLYCELRHVPTTQIVALDLPQTEEMAFDTYEMGIVGPVRQFITQNNLRDKIKCLVTMYGVPFRIRDKQNTPAEMREVAMLRDVQGDLKIEFQRAVEDVEAQTLRIDPSFVPGKDNTPEALAARAQAAIADASDKMRSMTDTAAEATALKQLLASLELIRGAAEIDARIGPSQRNDPNKSPEMRQHWIDIHQTVLQARDDVKRLQGLRWDAQARSQLRQIAKQYFGLVGLSGVVQSQIDYLTPEKTASATDSELALLWWDNYPRQNWIPNPMLWSFTARAPAITMVMRLDAPEPGIVEKLIRTSVEVEKKGLQGTIAIDARGKPPIDDKGNLDAFGEFDETLRHLAETLRMKTSMKIMLDDQEPVFRAHSVTNVALYVGWYSVNQYIPGCDFVPGAVGYHIASYEMVTLHTPSSRWVSGLLRNGVVATLGPVAEPYLSAFPKPDEFFPLLLTGKLTMAEVYWKTTPTASWMISFIGDPLYTPYKVNPQLKVEDLPVGLRRAFRGVEAQ